MVHAAASESASQCMHGNNSIMTVTCFDPLISPGVFSQYNLLSLEYLVACMRHVVALDSVATTMSCDYFFSLTFLKNKLWKLGLMVFILLYSNGLCLTMCTTCFCSFVVFPTLYLITLRLLYQTLNGFCTVH